MSTYRTKTFKSGNSEAVCLPKQIAFGEGTELVAVRSGDVLTLYPARMSVATMLERLADLPKPREIEVRNREDLPERDRL